MSNNSADSFTSFSSEFSNHNSEEFPFEWCHGTWDCCCGYRG
jgi:hypothetical protein